MVELHQDNFRNQKKDPLTRIFDFVMHIIGSTYNKVSIIPMDFLTEIHLRFYRYNKTTDKKILGYWDFNQQVGKLGDFMVFLETLSALRFEFNLQCDDAKNVDLCFIDDEVHHNSKLLKYAKTYHFKKNLMALAAVNSNIDSVLYFKSNGEFEQFYLKNKDKYIRWPSSVSGTASYDVRIIEQVYEKTGKLSIFCVPQDILSEIYQFYETNVYPSLPIILNMRNNVREPDKNSNAAEIKAFLRHYEKNKDYKFIIICNESEIPEDFRHLKNVLFSKDYFDSIEQDLALIKTSYLSIFPCSGMACFAWYGDVPFIQYGMHGTGAVYSGLPQKPLSHFLEYQQRYFTNESKEFLISKFDDLVNYLKKNNINNTLRNKMVEKRKYVSKF